MGDAGAAVALRASRPPSTAVCEAGEASARRVEVDGEGLVGATGPTATAPTPGAPPPQGGQSEVQRGQIIALLQRGQLASLSLQKETVQRRGCPIALGPAGRMHPPISGGHCAAPSRNESRHPHRGGGGCELPWPCSPSARGDDGDDHGRTGASPPARRAAAAGPSHTDSHTSSPPLTVGGRAGDVWCVGPRGARAAPATCRWLAAEGRRGTGGSRAVSNTHSHGACMHNKLVHGLFHLPPAPSPLVVHGAAMEVVKPQAKPQRLDPRFSGLSGNFNQGLFDSSYAFLVVGSNAYSPADDKFYMLTTFCRDFPGADCRSTLDAYGTRLVQFDAERGATKNITIPGVSGGPPSLIAQLDGNPILEGTTACAGAGLFWFVLGSPVYFSEKR
eukprot:gene33141-52084_t